MSTLRHGVRDGQRLGDVDVARGRAGAAAGRRLRLSALPQRAGDVPAVERQQRDQVEDEQRDVERGDELRRKTRPARCRLPADPRDSPPARLTGDPADADDATSGRWGRAGAGAERRLDDADHLLRDRERRRPAVPLSCSHTHPGTAVTDCALVDHAGPEETPEEAGRSVTTGSPSGVDERLAVGGRPGGRVADRRDRQGQLARRRARRRSCTAVPTRGRIARADVRGALTGCAVDGHDLVAGLDPGRGSAGVFGSVGAQVVLVARLGAGTTHSLTRRDAGAVAGRSRRRTA